MQNVLFFLSVISLFPSYVVNRFLKADTFSTLSDPSCSFSVKKKMSILLCLLNISLTFILWKMVFSQSMYEEKQWSSSFNRESNQMATQSTLENVKALLKETQSQLQTWKTKNDDGIKEYNDLLRMYNKQELPTGLYTVLIHVYVYMSYKKNINNIQ